MVGFELGYGVAMSQRRDADTERLNAFLAGALEWIDFDEDDAREARTVRAEVERAGKPIGVYDVLIAGQARRRHARVVTSNASEFDRIPGLKWERPGDYSKEARDLNARSVSRISNHLAATGTLP